MNYTKALVQSQFDTGTFPLIEGARIPYGIEQPAIDYFTTAQNVRSGWIDPDVDEEITARLRWGHVGSVRVVEVEGAGVDETVADHWGSHETYELDFLADWLAWNALIQVEAARTSREITKTKLQNIVGQWDREIVRISRDGRITIGKKQSSKPQWIAEVENLGIDRPTTRQLAKMIKTIKALSMGADYAEIDSGFRHIKLSSVSLEALVTLVRATYHCREHLLSWRAFLNSARKEAQKRGVDARETFVGLL